MDSSYLKIAELKESFDRNNKDVWKFVADICTDLEAIKSRMSTLYTLVDELKKDVVDQRRRIKV